MDDIFYTKSLQAVCKKKSLGLNRTSWLEMEEIRQELSVTVDEKPKYMASCFFPSSRLTGKTRWNEEGRSLNMKET